MQASSVPLAVRDTIENITTDFSLHIQDPSKLSLSSTFFLLSITVACYIFTRCFRYFTSELPPIGSGLKRLPGPRSTLPYLGRIHDVDRMHAWLAFKKFSDKYGGLFACTLGGETHIWVAREDVAQDLLVKNAAISSARADLGAYRGVTDDVKYLPLLGDTDAMVRQRKFAHAMMTRNITSKFQGHIDLETKQTMYELSQDPKQFYDSIHLFCARISSRLAYGHTEFSKDHVENAGAFIGQLGPSGPASNLAPFLRSFPEWMVFGQRGVRVRQEKEAKLWSSLFDAARQQHKRDGSSKTYASASLEMKALGQDVKLFQNVEEAKCAVGILCTVAIYTIAGPAVLFVMAMILHPEWQEKVRAQIDAVAGEGFVKLEHGPQLPILRAAIKECVRWKSTVPLGVPRLLAENYSYGGYHFPKGAVVHVLDIAMSQDPERYEQPDVYNPGRWLDKNSPNFRSPLTEHPRLKGHHIFGRGKRVCPGQDLAEAELIVLCGNLLKFFNVSTSRDAHGNEIWPNPEHWTTDVIGGPLPFECEIQIRDSTKLAMVKDGYAQSADRVLTGSREHDPCFAVSSFPAAPRCGEHS